MNLEQMTQLFKFMTLINIAILLISMVATICLKKIMGSIHGKLFGLQEEQIAQVGVEVLSRVHQHMLLGVGV